MIGFRYFSRSFADDFGSQRSGASSNGILSASCGLPNKTDHSKLLSRNTGLPYNGN